MAKLLSVDKGRYWRLPEGLKPFQFQNHDKDVQAFALSTWHRSHSLPIQGRGKIAENEGAPQDGKEGFASAKE